jgi:threonine dehydratase
VSGASVRLKLETLLPTFSYKIRGALNAVLRLSEQNGDRRPIVTASAGNHGRAMAWAAGTTGLRLTVYVPRTAPRTKLEAIRESGAALELCADYDEAERRAKAHGARGDAIYVSPYSHPDIIAGAGTVGLEILEEWPEVEVVVVPIGGGGLIGGIAIAAAAAGTTTVAGVEVEASSPFTTGLAAGRIVTIDVRPTLADGLAGNLDPDAVTFELVRDLVSLIALVSEEDLRNAIAGTAVHERLIAEGAGAAGVAAVLARKIDVENRRVAVVLSGGNIDQDKLKGVL